MQCVENNNFHQCLIDSMSSLYPSKAYSISNCLQCQHGWIKYKYFHWYCWINKFIYKKYIYRERETLYNYAMVIIWDFLFNVLH